MKRRARWAAEVFPSVDLCAGLLLGLAAGWLLYAGALAARGCAARRAATTEASRG